MSCRGGGRGAGAGAGCGCAPRSLMPPVARCCGFAGEKPAAVRLKKGWRTHGGRIKGGPSQYPERLLRSPFSGSPGFKRLQRPFIISALDRRASTPLTACLSQIGGHQTPLTLTLTHGHRSTTTRRVATSSYDLPPSTLQGCSHSRASHYLLEDAGCSSVNSVGASRSDVNILD